MADPFLAEIRIVPFNFAPKGWALCNGQLILISQNTALFALIGTTYGGNGQSTFALPDLRGRVPIHQGPGPGLTNRVHGASGGSAAVALDISQIPAHTHTVSASNDAARASAPGDGAWAPSETSNAYRGQNIDTTMSSQALATVGSSQPHNNMPPYLALNFIIALQGIYPPRS